MAVDTTAVIVPASEEGYSPTLLDRVEEHPLITSVLAILVAVVIGYLWNKVHGGSTTTSAQPTNAPGTPTDATGRQVYYVPTSNTFLNYNSVQGSYDTTTTVNNDEDHIHNNPGTPSPLPPPVVPHPIDELVRKRFSQPGAVAYDTVTPGGVPVRSAPGGKQVGLAPYGSVLQLSSTTPVTGPSNFAGPAKNSGTDLWYKLDSGNWISQYDIVLSGGFPPPRATPL